MNRALAGYYKNKLIFNQKRSISFLLFLLGLLFFPFFKRVAVRLFMQSHRVKNRPYVVSFCLRNNLFSDQFIGRMYSNKVSAQAAAKRTIILSYPDFSGSEVATKGVCLITFTDTLGFYLNNIQLGSMEKYFHIVLEPSWAGYLDPDIIGWMNKCSSKVFIQTTEISDRVLLESAFHNFKVLSFGASDWVDNRFFNAEKDNKMYDSIYVANSNPVKRVVRFFLAVQTIIKTHPTYKACLVCAEWGGYAINDYRDLAKQYGICKNIDLKFSLSQKELVVLFGKSKVNVLLSFKEGSNRSLFESIFADVPVLLVAENVGTNKAYINESTGRLVHDSFLEDALIFMAASWHEYRPRQWAMANISPELTTGKLRDAIYSDCKLENRPSLLVKTNNPEVNYFDYKSIDNSFFSMRLIELFEKSQDAQECQARIEEIKVIFMSELANKAS